MRKFYVLLVLSAVPLTVFFGCKHDPVLPEHEVSFSQEILPILQMGCTHSGCHGDSLNAEHRLTSYNDVMDFGEVKAGEPLDSKLFRVLNENGEDRMPQEPYAPLSKRNQDLIYIWIAQGAKDN